MQTQPKSAWCVACQATTYRTDEDVCIPCAVVIGKRVRSLLQKGKR